MSYQVLARKYRPRSFEQLRGQEHVVQALANALTQGRLHHAYLFTGTRGVGKTTVSRILAKSLNCTGADGQGGITAHPCGVCDACRDIDAGRFVDYIELDAASNRGVEEISLLLDQAVYKPVVGRFKVYMIDEVHMLSNTAFNAMLKTLEEPPDYLKFVLATTDPQKVPPTVLSRCLQFNLRPMAPQTVHEHLGHVLADEGITAEPGALRLLARAARGSMRDALSLTDQAVAFGAGVLTEAGVRQMLGAVDRGHAVRILEALAAGDGAALVAAVDALRGLGLSAAGTLEELAQMLQQMAVAQAVPQSLDANDPEHAVIARLAGLLAADETQLAYSMALHGRAELGLAPDEYSGLVMVLLRMLAFRPTGGMARPTVGRPDDTATPAASREAETAATGRAAPAGSKIDAPALATATATTPRAASRGPHAHAAMQASQKKALESSPQVRRVEQPMEEPPPWMDAPFEMDAPLPTRHDEPMSVRTPEAATRPEPLPTAPTVAPEGSTRPLVRTELGDRWAGLVERMIGQGGITALVRELALQSQCLSVGSDGGTAVWRLRTERETLRAPAQRDKLQTAIGEALGQPVRLELEAGAVEDSPALRAAAERDRRQREAEQIIHNDPLVMALLAQFKGARIVPGSIKPH